MAKLVGLYTGTQQMIEDPVYFDVLKQELGLTHVIMGGAYTLTETTRALNPMPPGSEDEAPSRGSSEDSELKKAIDIAHSKDLQVWFCTGGWHGRGEKYPDMCMQDMHHRPISQVPKMRFSLEQYSLATCPSDETMSAWLQAVMKDVMAYYPYDGVDLTHFRYTAPSFLHNLFGCGCTRCEALADSRGYDFKRMRNSALTFWDRIQNLEAGEVRRATDQGIGLMDLSEWLGIDAGLTEWFDFRAGVINHNLASFRDGAYEGAAGRPIMFGSDTFPPTFARLVGHSYRDSMKWADYTSTLISHVEVFVLSTFATYADLLCEWTDGLSEEDALRFVYRLFGYDHIEKMPLSFEALGIAQPNCENNTEALYDIVELELQRARLYNDGSIPSYPVIKGATWPTKIVRGLVDAAEHMGHDGIIFQGTDALVKYGD